MPGFAKMFGVFVTKQTSKFCGTNRQLSRIDPRVANVCPSCGANDESSKHITRCNDDARVECWRRSADTIAAWIATATSNLPLRDMVHEYLLARDSKTMSDCLHIDDHDLQLLASIHDRLGWDNFVEGRICSMYIQVAASSFHERSRFTPSSWGMELIKLLLTATHKQWLFRNHHVHFAKLDGLTTAQHDEIFRRVEELIDIDPADLLTGHRHLLDETDFEALGEGSAGDRQIWISSMEFAIAAADLVRAGRPIWGDMGDLSPPAPNPTEIRPASLSPPI